jgi:hypothetical protein
MALLHYTTFCSPLPHALQISKAKLLGRVAIICKHFNHYYQINLQADGFLEVKDELS